MQFHSTRLLRSPFFMCRRSLRDWKHSKSSFWLTYPWWHELGEYFYCSQIRSMGREDWSLYCCHSLLTTDYHMYIRLSTKCSCQVCSLCAEKGKAIWKMITIFPSISLDSSSLCCSSLSRRSTSTRDDMKRRAHTWTQSVVLSRVAVRQKGKKDGATEDRPTIT